MVDKFLHKIDLESLKKETGLTIDEIGELVEIKNHKGVYNWAKSQIDHGTRPSFNAIVRLLEAGATTKTLFGVDCNNGGPKPPDTPELRAGQQQALKDIEATIAARVKNEILTDLKNKGVI